jgi:hypothetical protein
MYSLRKFWLVLGGAILVLAVIACSCGSLTPTPTAPPPPTMAPPPTALPSPTVPVNPMPALAGYWLDTETNDVHIIAWQNGQYKVTATNDSEYGSFPVTDQSWNGSALTWTYKVSYNDTSVTFTTVSVSGDSLYTSWSNSTGDSGTETMQRVSSPIPPAVVDQEPMPGLAGSWLDTDTQVTHTIEWQNGKYVVVSAIDAEEGPFPVTDQSWLNDTLTWTYTRPSTGTSVTFKTVSVSGNILNTTWTNSQGDSGTWDLERTSSAPVNQEPIPGLAGKWDDPDTHTVHTIAWIVDSYVVTSSVNPNNGSYEITDQNWDGSSLTWTYYVAVNKLSVTIKTISVDGDTLNFSWSQTSGESGTDAYTRVP